MPDRKLRRAEVTEESAAVSSRTGRRIEAPGAGKETRPVVAPEQLREERLGEKDNKQDPWNGPTMPLKKGAGQMELGWARIVDESLRHLLERYPGHFRALHALVEGRGGEVSKEHRRDLRKWSFLLHDGSPNPAFKAIMVAAYRETPDGPTIVDPVAVKTPEDAAAVRRFNDQGEKRYKKGAKNLLRRLLEEDKDEGNDRSR